MATICLAITLCWAFRCGVEAGLKYGLVGEYSSALNHVPAIKEFPTWLD
jgi:hypothetical protein